MSLESLLPAFVGSLVMALLYAASLKKPDCDDGGNLILRLPRIYGIIGLVLILGGLALALIAMFFTEGSDTLQVSLLSFIALALGLFLFGKGYVFHIKVTDTELVEATVFGKKKEIKWNEIVNFSFGTVSQELKIYGRNNTIKAHLRLIGFQELIERIEMKTMKTAVELGIPA